MKKSYAGVAALCMSATVAYADCGDVSLSEPTFAGGTLSASIIKFFLEQGYGCSVTTMPGSSVTTLTSIAETGTPDILAEVAPNSAPVYYEMEAEGKVVTLSNVISEGYLEGWWVPKYLADAHPAVMTIDGILADPSIVGGMFHNCPNGWGCRVKNDNLKVAFEFEAAGLEVFDHGSGETLSSSMAAAYADEAPWFGYYWAPTAVMGRYEMVQVDMGEFDETAYNCMREPDCTNPQRTSFKTSPAVLAATRDFEQREPDVADMLKRLSLTNADKQILLAWQEDNNASSDETAVYFIQNFQDVWSGWLNDAALEKLSPLLK
jgi:glycine betaine/proline transport system substrate-binding protein